MLGSEWGSLVVSLVVFHACHAAKSIQLTWASQASRCSGSTARLRHSLAVLVRLLPQCPGPRRAAWAAAAAASAGQPSTSCPGYLDFKLL